MADKKFIDGPESTWGTQATAWRQMEEDSDDFKTDVQVKSYRGIGASGGPSASTRTTAPMGGRRTKSVPIYDRGLGIYMRAAGSSFAHTNIEGDAFQQVTEFDGLTGPSASSAISTIAYRDQANGTLVPFIGRGGYVENLVLTIEQGDENFAKLDYQIRYKEVVRATPSPTPSPVKIQPAHLFSWTDSSAGLVLEDEDGNDFTDCIKKLVVTIPNPLDFDDRCIGNVQHRPTMSGMMAPTLEAEWKFQHPRPYDAYVNGTVFGLSLTLTSPDEIEDDIFASFKVEVPAFAYDQNDPVMQVDGPTMQTMPGTVLDNGTDPMVRFTQVTRDTAA